MADVTNTDSEAANMVLFLTTALNKHKGDADALLAFENAFDHLRARCRILRGAGNPETQVPLGNAGSLEREDG